MRDEVSQCEKRSLLRHASRVGDQRRGVEGQEEIQEYEVTDVFAFGDIQRTHTEITASDIESESWMVTLRANTMGVTGLWLLIGRKQNWRRGS